MLSLLIENCTERGIVAFVENEHCLYFAGLPFGYHNSRFLLPKIDEGFQSIQKTPQELDLIVAGIGPGSYTGIRVGAIIAKSLSYASKIPLVGISTLKGFIPDRDGPFLAILDAKMSGCYVIKGKREEGIITYATEPKALQLKKIKEEFEGRGILVGPHCLSLQQKLKKIDPDALWCWQETAPDPIHMTKLGQEKFHQGKFSTDGSLQILYLQE
ncbi:MAG: tRNA (adenosine(37)-N6)-threonylcarbamoyltransferase complex dimerization subunit type 1 TsaB [Waddliaceae bacterium]